MEKERKSDSALIAYVEALWGNETEISFENFISMVPQIEKLKENMLSYYPDADNFNVSFSFKEAINYEHHIDEGWLKIELTFDRLETDKEFEARVKMAEEAERSSAALLEADKQNRISEAKKLLEENGYVVAR